MTTNQLSLFEQQPAPRKAKAITRRKLTMTDHRREPLHCDDCGADLSRGVSEVLHGGTRNYTELCLKCAARRKGTRNNNGRKLKDSIVKTGQIQVPGIT